MTYETMDWEVEAKRVARAFGIKDKCDFVPSENEYVLRRDETGWLSCGDEIWVSVRYKCSHRDLMLVKERKSIGIEIVYDDNYSSARIYCGISGVENLELQTYLAYALFHLNLLTTEIAQELGVTLTAHEKLEWTLEYEARYK